MAIQLTVAAQQNVDETGVSPESDLADLVSGALSEGDLLAACLDGADDDRVAGWREYVAALVALSGVAS
jgi:hypothetical protein